MWSAYFHRGNGAGCFGHVAFGVLGKGAWSAVDTRNVEVGFHSPGLRHANVTAITGIGLGRGMILIWPSDCRRQAAEQMVGFQNLSSVAEGTIFSTHK